MTFCPNPQLLTHWWLKQCQRTKIYNVFWHPLPTPSSVSTQSSQYQDWKANKNSILAVNELGPLVLEFSARISKFHAPTDSECKFNKMEIKKWLPMGYKLRSSWLGTCSHNCYTMFIGITMETFHFLGSVQVLSNPTPITQSSINCQ